MKYFLLVILIFFSLASRGQQQEVLSLDLREVDFSVFASLVNDQSGIQIYYEPQLAGELKVTLQDDSIPVPEAIESAIAGTSLKVSAWNNGYLLLPGEQLIETLPDYASRVLDIEESGTEEVTYGEQRYLQGRKSDVTETLTIGNANVRENGKVRISGYIRDEDTGEPIIGATVYIEEIKSGAASDLQGYFAIVLPTGKYNAQFASLGYETGKYQLDVYSDDRIQVALETAPVTLEEAVIRGDRQMDIKKKDPGLEKLSIKSIRAIPMMMGERDIIKVSEMLPGIVSVGEGSSGLNVRGGSSDQNVFYINKIPIYNTSHLFGFFPAFNSDIIKDFSIYKGHIPAEYGGRLSSVFNITTRQGNKKNFSMRGGLNPISANVTVEGPVIKDKSSVLISARSSYSDWVLNEINDPVLKNSSAGFNDFSIYLDHHLENTVFSGFVYSSSDRFELADLNSYTYANLGGSLNMHHNFNNLLRLDVALIGSRYGFQTTDKQNISTAYSHAYDIDHYELRADFTQTINESNELYFGVNAVYYMLDRGSVLPFGEESLRSVNNLGTEKGVENAIYISDKYSVTNWLDINAGFRYAFYAPLGEKEVYTYEQNLPKQARYITDTLSFQRNEPVKWYTSPEFRVSVNIRTDFDGNIKLAFNQMSQNLFMLNNTIAIAPNTQWKLADYHIRPSRSNQYSAGVFRTIPGTSLETSAEFFYKITSDYTEFKDGADFLNNPLVETEVLQGDHNSYGVELLIRKNLGRINGWLAYTYSRSYVQVNGGAPWEKINNGKTYPSNYDIPHVVNAVVNYELSKRITLSGVVTYQRGKPVTYPVSIYHVEELPVIDYFERNKYRIPDYFRTDLSLTIEGNLKKDKLIHSSWMFSLYNATGRKNAYSVFFLSQQGRIKSYKYSVIGIPFFTATWLFKLGNYASQ